ncbi:MAG: DoxX family protein [Dehalococcoidia bacterium]
MLGRFPMSVTQLVLRIAVALPFWRSGQTKWTGWFELSDSAVYLFEEEFRIHLFGQTYAYPFPQLTAYASAVAEIILPLMLVLGLGTRFAALGVLFMTAIIQLTVPDGWETYHLPWAAMALAVMTYGPGRLSVDRLIRAHLGSSTK